MFLEILYALLTSHRNELPQLPQLAVEPIPSPSVATLPPSKTELPSRTIVAKGSLDDMFARLSGATPSVSLRPAKELSPVGPDKSMFSFDDHADTSSAAAKVSTASLEAQTRSHPALARPNTEHPQEIATHTQPLSEVIPSTTSWQGKSQNEREAEYLHKAATYFSTLPTRPGDSAHIIKTVAIKLHTAFAPNVTKLQPEEVEKLRARCVFAVTNFINKKVKLSPEPLTADFAKKVLCDSEGDFLQLCAALVKGGYIALDSIKQVADLCQIVLGVLPKADNTPTTETFLKGSKVDELPKSAASMASVVDTSTKVSGDPLEGMKAWPTQEKREHGT